MYPLLATPRAPAGIPPFQHSSAAKLRCLQGLHHHLRYLAFCWAPLCAHQPPARRRAAALPAAREPAHVRAPVLWRVAANGRLCSPLASPAVKLRVSGVYALACHFRLLRGEPCRSGCLPPPLARCTPPTCFADIPALLPAAAVVCRWFFCRCALRVLCLPRACLSSASLLFGLHGIRAQHRAPPAHTHTTRLKLRRCTYAYPSLLLVFGCL